MFKPLSDVLIIVPATHSVTVQLVPKLIKWASMGADINFVTAPFIDNARNIAVRQFLSTKKKYLLFIDSDVIPEIDAPERLLEANKGIIAGIYNLLMGPSPVGSAIIKPGAFPELKPNRPLYESPSVIPRSGLQKVEILSGGLLLIKRDVLEKIPDPWFEIRWLDPQRSAFEGEDVNFCRKATKEGFELWCDGDVIAFHYKTMPI